MAITKIIGTESYGSLNEAPSAWLTPAERKQARVYMAKRKELANKSRFALYKSQGDEDKIKELADLDDHIAECEICGNWFWKKSLASEAVCDECNDEKFISFQQGKKSNRYVCKWCGRTFSRTIFWASTKFCCDECREVELDIRIRERNRILRNLKRDKEDRSQSKNQP